MAGTGQDFAREKRDYLSNKRSQRRHHRHFWSWLTKLSQWAALHFWSPQIHLFYHQASTNSTAPSGTGPETGTVTTPPSSQAVVFVLCLLQEQHKMPAAVFSNKMRENSYIHKTQSSTRICPRWYKTDPLLFREVSHTLGKISLESVKLCYCEILKIRDHHSI